LDFLSYKIIQLGGYELTALNLILVVVSYLGTHLVLAILLSYFSKLVKRRDYDAGRAHSISLLITYFVWVVSILFMLSLVGLKASVLVASSAALFVGLGLGMQSIFKDFVSGIFLLFEGTIEVGDILEVDKIIGRVEQIHLRTTKVITRDGVVVIVPNSKVLSENVVNWTHNTTATRIRIPIRVPFRADAQIVQQILLRVATQNELKDAEVRIAAFEEKFVLYELVYWSAGSLDLEDTKSDLRFEIIAAFAAQEIRLSLD
jgi:small-conductance mechanosensitive channel